MSNRAAILIPAALVARVALVVVPLAIDQPFAAQTPRIMALAFTIRRWSPFISLAVSALVIVLAASRWRRTRRVVVKVALAAAVAVSLGAVWLARQNPFEWMFNPQAQARHVPARDASFVADSDLVLAVTLDQDAAAYPIRQLAYHHLVNDRIGGLPAVVTY
jgi:hypothetical protein